MNYYGVAFASYWTGSTGRALRQRGGKDTQLLGAYLLFNAHMNMLGLYELKLHDIRDDIEISPRAAVQAFQVMADEQYAFYDESTAFVWVREMARFRLNIRDEKPLDKSDNKVIGARKLYESLPSNPWLGPFFDRYAKLLHLKTRRNFTRPQPVVVGKGTSSNSEGASKGLPRGFEASNQISDQRSVDQKDKSSALRAPHPLTEVPAENLGVITKLAHQAIDQLGPAHPDLTEAIKSLCASSRIAYDSATVRKAIESASVQRKRRHA